MKLRRPDMRRTAWLSLSLNLLYAVYNAVLGARIPSAWFGCAAAHHAVLSVMRFSILRYGMNCRRRERGLRIVRMSGKMLLPLAAVFAASVALTLTADSGRAHHEIIMITIAMHAFVKLTLAIVHFVRSGRGNLAAQAALRSISLADSAVSPFSMQRSMLASFGDMAPGDIRLLNGLTGAAACAVVVLLGVRMIFYERKEWKMAKSKLVEVNDKIAKKVTEGFGKITDAVVGGYKKVEDGVTGGYEKIEDKFVETYLTREGETVEDAKKRLKGEQE